MVQHIPGRLIRGYAVFVLGLILFFARPYFAPDTYDRQGVPLLGAVLTRTLGCLSGERALCVEPAIVVGTTVLMTLAVAGGRFRATLVALAFTFPPLLIYLTLYPIWIVLIMLILMPIMTHAALNAWLPEAAEAG